MPSAGPTLLTELSVRLPDWIEDLPSLSTSFPTDHDKMRLAIDLSRRNVERKTGGPFGAAVFERDTHRLVAVGVNSVVRLNNSSMHAEVFALMLAQARAGVFSLHAAGLPECELFTSCEPCAMCLGALLWSGVRRVVCGANRVDAGRIGFEEGPVFPQSHDYVRERGVHIELDFLRDEAKAVLDAYERSNGLIYNA